MIYIGLFDRSLLHVIKSGRISQKQNATSKSYTSIHVPIRPYVNSTWEIIKTSQVEIFFFSIMERIRKGSDLPKKKWGY